MSRQAQRYALSAVLVRATTGLTLQRSDESESLMEAGIVVEEDEPDSDVEELNEH